MNIKLKKLFFLTILLAFFCSAQKSKSDIDSLFLESKKLFTKGKLKESISLSKKSAIAYEQLNEEKSLIQAYLHIANVYSNLYDLKESIHYLDLANERFEKIKEPILLAQMFAEYGRVYKNLGYKSKALEYYDKAINLMVPEENNKKKLQYYYSLKSIILEENKSPELHYNLRKAHQLSPDVYTAARLAKYFITVQKKLDSAKYYLELGNQLNNEGSYPIFQKSILLRNWGRYYLEKKDFRKAIFFLESSLSISQKLEKPQDIKETRKLLFEAYKMNSDDDKAMNNLEKYTKINDSIETELSQVQEVPLKKMNKENIAFQKSTKTLLLSILIFVLISVLILWIIFRKKGAKEKKEIQLKYKLKEENLELQLRLNEAFEEVVQLAKTNSPEFLTRFSEIYPDYYNKLITIEPKLLNTEIKLCAMIYLGFSSKDIAEYTFVTLKAAQHRKFRLRKKLNIPSEADIKTWLEENI